MGPSQAQREVPWLLAAVMTWTFVSTAIITRLSYENPFSARPRPSTLAASVASLTTAAVAAAPAILLASLATFSRPASLWPRGAAHPLVRAMFPGGVLPACLVATPRRHPGRASGSPGARRRWAYAIASACAASGCVAVAGASFAALHGSEGSGGGDAFGGVAAVAALAAFLSAARWFADGGFCLVAQKSVGARSGSRLSLVVPTVPPCVVSAFLEAALWAAAFRVLATVARVSGEGGASSDTDAAAHALLVGLFIHGFAARMSRILARVILAERPRESVTGVRLISMLRRYGSAKATRDGDRTRISVMLDLLDVARAGPLGRKVVYRDQEHWGVALNACIAPVIELAGRLEAAAWVGGGGSVSSAARMAAAAVAGGKGSGDGAATPGAESRLRIGAHGSVVRGPASARRRGAENSVLALVEYVTGMPSRIAAQISARYAPDARTEAANTCVDAECVMIGAEAVSLLAAASLREDDLGTVQHTLSGLISALLAALCAVESHLELRGVARARADAAYGASAGASGSANLPELRGHVLVNPTFVALSSVLSTALHRIVETFYEHIPALTFAPRYAARLQAICDFHG